MSKIDVAIRCFQENIRLFSNPDTAPEKYNLYTGLAAMAESLREIEARLRSTL